jgi:hypothetical protein
MTKRSLLLLFGLLAVLSACSRNKANPPEEPVIASVPLGTITLVPVETPKALVTDNRSPPVVGILWTGIANTVMDKGKSADFDAKYGDFRKQIGAKFTQAVQQGLQAQGFQVRLANPNDVERNKDNILNVAKFAGHEAVLDIWIDDFSMYSGRTNSNYLPLINTTVALVNPASSRQHLLDSWYSYGAQADTTGDGYIRSDPKFTFPNFEALMSQPPLVVESFDEGIRLIVANLLRDFKKEFRPTSPLVPTPAKQAAVANANGSAAPPEPPTANAKKPKVTKTGKRQPTATTSAASR